MNVQTADYELNKNIKITLYQHIDGSLRPLRHFGRDFIKVSYTNGNTTINQAFYRSTGLHDSNSGTEGMWFPTDGITFNGGIKKNGQDERLTNMTWMTPLLNNEYLSNNNVNNIVLRLHSLFTKTNKEGNSLIYLFESKISKLGDYMVVYDIYKDYEKTMENKLPKDIIKRYCNYDLMYISYMLSHSINSTIINDIQSILPNDLILPNTAILNTDGINVDFITINNYISDFISFNYINEPDYIELRSRHGKFDLSHYTNWSEEESDPCGIIYYGSLKSHILSDESKKFNEVIHQYVKQIITFTNEQNPLDTPANVSCDNMSPDYMCINKLVDLYLYVSMFITTYLDTNTVRLLKHFKKCKKKKMFKCKLNENDLAIDIGKIQKDFFNIDKDFFKYCSLNTPSKYTSKIDYYYNSIIQIFKNLQSVYYKYFIDSDYMNVMFSTFEMTVNKYVTDLKDRTDFLIEDYFAPPILGLTNIIDEDDKGYIRSAYKISQHQINYTLFTNIGELHQRYFNCCYNNKPTFTISQYCIDRLKSNPKCILLLEYHDNLVKHLIGSEVIQEIFTTGLDAETLGRIRGIDTRFKFLGKDHVKQNILYTQQFNTIYTNNKKKWFDDYVKIFNYQMLVNEISIITDEVMKQRLGQYVYHIQQNWLQLIEKFNNPKVSFEELLYSTRYFWALVMDFEVLKNILQNSSANEFVLVVGLSHQENLQKIMEELFTNETRTLVALNGSDCNCINYKDLKKQS